MITLGGNKTNQLSISFRLACNNNFGCSFKKSRSLMHNTECKVGNALNTVVITRVVDVNRKLSGNFSISLLQGRFVTVVWFKTFLQKTQVVLPNRISKYKEWSNYFYIILVVGTQLFITSHIRNQPNAKGRKWQIAVTSIDTSLTW